MLNEQERLKRNINTREERVHDMVWSIDPDQSMRNMGLDVAAMAERAVAKYEQYRPASVDQMKRLEEITKKVYWIREHACDLRNHLIEKIGAFIYHGCGIETEFDELIEEITEARKVQP